MNTRESTGCQESICRTYVTALGICEDDPDEDYCQKTLPMKVRSYLQILNQIDEDQREAADYNYQPKRSFGILINIGQKKLVCKAKIFP